MAGEVCAEQLIRAVADLLAALPMRFDRSAMRWLTRHNELEGDHADESLVIARLVPPEAPAVESVTRGASGVHDALWDSLGELEASCFPK
jgi:hypothetical protein